MPVIIPSCEYCKSPMKFFDEAWVEDELLIVASVICTNQDCLNSSVIYIHAQQGVQADGDYWCCQKCNSFCSVDFANCGLCGTPRC